MPQSSASRTDPATVERTLHQAVGLHQQGRLAQAETIYRTILLEQPEHFDALHLLGVVRQQRRDPQEALRLIGAALKLQATAPALANYGSVLESLNRPLEALTCFEKAIELAPAFADAHSNRSHVLQGLKRHAEALDAAEAALANEPRHVDALLNRSNALAALNRLPEALASAAKALSVAPTHVQALNRHGSLLIDLGRYDEAARSLEQALRIDPNSIHALNNLANLHQQTGFIEKSIEVYEQALKIAPEHPNLNFNSAIARLSLGDFDEGWKRYEWRWKNPLFRSRKRNFSQPLWLGEFSLEGKTILLHAEQGLGDTLQFVRYVPMVAALGAHVVLEVQGSLKPLLAQTKGITRILDTEEEHPPFDCHCPLMSLPLAFGTRLDTIPNSGPYLEAPSERIANWKDKLAAGKLRVGVAWSGSEKHKHDSNRSISFAALAPLLTEPGAKFFSIQREVRAGDAAPLSSNTNIVHLGGDLDDFADTAAVISHLDLVVTVDTAVAHLAGAMGKPTWILVPFWADFRWLQHRTDSPWYPTATLFRQPRPNDWPAPIDQIRAELRQWSKSHPA